MKRQPFFRSELDRQTLTSLHSQPEYAVEYFVVGGITYVVACIYDLWTTGDEKRTIALLKAVKKSENIDNKEFARQTGMMIWHLMRAGLASDEEILRFIQVCTQADFLIPNDQTGEFEVPDTEYW